MNSKCTSTKSKKQRKDDKRMIKVNEKYCIGMNGDSYTIFLKMYSENRREDYYRPLCYPRTLSQAVSKIMRFSFEEKIEERDMSLKEALQVLKEINEEYQSILDEIREMEILE